LPLDVDSGEIFEKIKDGVIVVKLLNLAKPGVINEARYHKSASANLFQKIENLNIALKAAQKLGASLSLSLL
jgi:hypothetical protein